MMYDATGVLLYVGKAKNLNARLRQYLDISQLEWHKRVMRSLVARVEWQRCATESEALVLEQELIKTQKPKYNIMLTDGKMYPMLALTKHQFPRLVKFRGKISQKKDVFGPYPSAGALNDAIKTIQKVCQVRTCTDGFMRNRARPCLLHQIGRCSAPCALCAQSIDYDNNVKLARRILSGDIQSATKELSKEMQAASDRMDFEKAAELRDKISALSATATRGRMRAQKADDFSESFAALEKWLRMKIEKAFVFDNSHLFGKSPVGAMIAFDRAGFVKSEYRHFKLKDNARAGNDIAMMEEFLLRFAQKDETRNAKRETRDSENMNNTVHYNGQCTSLYDLRVSRLASRVSLIIVDGGKAQWNIAKKTLGDAAAILGVTKGIVRDGDEHFIMPDGDEDRGLAKNSPVFLFLRRVRDEAHRFAISFHRRSRGKSAITSALDEIEGIGAARKKALLHHFGSVRQIADSTAADIARAPGISKTIAEKIYLHFHP